MRNVIFVLVKLTMGVELSSCTNLVRWLFIFFNIPILVSFWAFHQLRYYIIAVTGVGVARNRNMASSSG